MFTTFVILGIVILLLGVMALRLSVAAFEPVRSTALGPLTLELRRRTVLRAADAGGGGHVGKSFQGAPAGAMAPYEQRLRVLRVAGLPLWRQRATRRLPLQVATMMGTLTARDFDVEFDTRFRVASYDLLMPGSRARLKRGGAGLERAKG